MPELPEVEIARRNLERWFRGRTVVDAEAERTRIFRGAKSSAFKSVRGRLIDVSRKGKYLLLSFDEGRGVLTHFGMTGKWVRRHKGQTEPYSRARFILDDDEVIHFRDPRMFGRIQPLESDQLWKTEVIQRLGRDPLADGLTPAQLRVAVGSSRQPIKVALLNQTRIAGLGNIHATEALFRSKIHPARLPGGLKAEEWMRLNRGILQAIRFALAQEESDEIHYVEERDTENPFLVYGRAGEPCRRCGTRIRSFVQAGRTTYFCPNCQRKRSTP
jgi:formamidopyrimidine-DNA glycosylase